MRLFDWLRLARPKQWPKNLLVLAALLFSGRFREGAALVQALCGFAVFVLLSASVYAFNDLRDADADRKHPSKKNRPVASGRVSRAEAWALSLAWALLGLGGAYALGLGFFCMAAGYLALSTLYSQWTKHQVILDVLSLAAGFVLRAAAGALVLDVRISEWLLLCTTLLAMFVGLTKRRAELAALPAGVKSQRATLSHYSLTLLDQMISVVAAATVVGYALYAFSSNPTHRGPWMMLTIPYVIYAIFRYLYLSHQKGQGAAPEEVLLGDRPTQVNLLLYIATSAAILALARP